MHPSLRPSLALPLLVLLLVALLLVAAGCGGEEEGADGTVAADDVVVPDDQDADGMTAAPVAGAADDEVVGDIGECLHGHGFVLVTEEVHPAAERAWRHRSEPVQALYTSDADRSFPIATALASDETPANVAGPGFVVVGTGPAAVDAATCAPA
jgi:hypothetical protein